MKRVLGAIACSVGLSSAGCTTEDVDVPVETTSAGGASSVSMSSSQSSTSSTQSSTASTSTTCGNAACTPITITTPEILTFSDSDSFEGGTFSYGTGVSDAVVNEEWHISGQVSTYSGFGLAFPCMADVSQFSGVRFSIRGSIGGEYVALSANTASNSSFSCDQQHNTCSGGCANSEAEVALSDEPTSVSFTWADFSGGSPNAQPDPSELLSLVWVLKWNDAASPYAVDLTVDDIEFIE